MGSLGWLSHQGTFYSWNPCHDEKLGRFAIFIPHVEKSDFKAAFEYGLAYCWVVSTQLENKGIL